MGNPECKLVVDDVDIIEEMNVTTLALGSWSKQGHGKVQVRNATWESHLHSQSVRECEGMNSHTTKWTPILGIGILMESGIFK
jgi:hypothetical protein